MSIDEELITFAWMVGCTKRKHCAPSLSMEKQQHNTYGFTWAFECAFVEIIISLFLAYGN